jgi:hypothetical protein
MINTFSKVHAEGNFLDLIKNIYQKEKSTSNVIVSDEKLDDFQEKDVFSHNSFLTQYLNP